jgi:hypothetical protein
VSDLHAIAAQLLSALATPMQNGSVTLSFHEGRLASVKTETHQRVFEQHPAPSERRVAADIVQARKAMNFADGVSRLLTPR